MFSESIGYAIFRGDRNESSESGYAFFCEDTRKSDRDEKWLKLAGSDGVGGKYSDVLSQNWLTFSSFEEIEKYGPISDKNYKTFSYHLDSTYFENNQKLYSIHFEKNNDKGNLHVYADNNQLKSINYSSKTDNSYVLRKKVNEKMNIRFTYYDAVPYISSVSIWYNQDGLEYWNEYATLLQKYDKFNLDRGDVWGLIYFRGIPYVEYHPGTWTAYNITRDQDFSTINSQLKTASKTLEEQFVANSGKRWLPDFQINKDIIKPQDVDEMMAQAPKIVSKLKRFF
jgi:hypothetical protein